RARGAVDVSRSALRGGAVRSWSLSGGPVAGGVDAGRGAPAVPVARGIPLGLVLARAAFFRRACATVPRDGCRARAPSSAPRCLDPPSPVRATAGTAVAFEGRRMDATRRDLRALLHATAQRS